MTEFLRKISKTQIRNVIAMMDTLLIFTVILVMLFHEIPKENKDMVNMFVGALVTGCLINNRNFLYGSSKSETDKAKKENADQ